jgi:hypothetical protein
MKVTIPVRAATVAGCAALLLAGCSGGPGSSPTSSKGSSDYDPGPLDVYMSQIYGYSLDGDQSQDELQAESDRQQRESEEIVASCMQEQGFEYTPVENTGVYISGDDLDVEWGTKEFAEKYGYGISTDPWGTEDMPVDDGEEYVDPNQDYVDAMSASEQEAYWAALYGEPVTSDDPEATEAAEWDWTTAGCQGKAQHEVYDAGQDSEEFADLEEEMNGIWDQLSSDPRVTELDAAWASCMADAGYEGMTIQSDATTALYDEWSDIQGWNDPDYNEQVENWDWEAEPEGPPMPTPDADEAKAFTDKEIAQAVADFTCKDKVKYDETWSAINKEIQQDFVDQHKAELDAWVEAATAARSDADS